jgi:HEAT repeat protein
MDQDPPAVGRPALDWERLAREAGAIREDGEAGGSDFARRALEAIIGPEAWRAAVDHYVECRPGAELARSVLWLVRPWSAMERCRDLSRTDPDADRRRSAVELLRVVADRRALPWVREYLDDGDAGVQLWAAGIVDQLVWSDLVEPEECADLIAAMSSHPNEGVRRMAEWIQSFLRERQAAAERDVALDRHPAT